ncbi:MAG TPA: NlpC/P60 family protein [Feifaniaceae bacterium]|nr:NlpC/P60 family protein [Feifaniaceae bacterium]
MRRRALCLYLSCVLLLGVFLQAGGRPALAEGAPQTPPASLPEATPATTLPPEPAPIPETPPGEPTPTLTPPAETPVPSPELTPTPSASPTPSPSPTPLPYAVWIDANDITIPAGTQLDLSSLAYAEDELGQELFVTVADDGGFSADIPGVYVVRFFAWHPLGDEMATAFSVVTVLAPEPEEEKSTLIGTSDSRYRKYREYRDMISEDLNQIISGLNREFEERVALLQGAFDDAERFELLRSVPVQEETDALGPAQAATESALTPLETPTVSNWSEVLAVFVAKSSLDVEEPLDLYNLRKIPLDGIKDVFWEMHSLSFHVENGALKVMLTEKSSQEMALLYGFDGNRAAQLDELMQPEFLRMFASLTGDASFSDMTKEQEEQIRESLPEGLTMQRGQVVLTAYSMAGQIEYFWGGKYPAVGWNPLWGVPKVVTSSGSVTTGTVQNFGLDCSGFVTWAFINAAKDVKLLDAVGDGSARQWSNSMTLGWDEAQPGDLAFRAAPGTSAINHVGIVVEKREDGTYLVAHCSSSRDTVVVTEAWSSGFRYMRKPVLYADA